jgi:hypothetical protein
LIGSSGLPRRPQIAFDFDAVPSDLEDVIPDERLDKLFRILLRLARRGIHDPSLRWLAAKMRKSKRMVQRYLRRLVALGHLAIEAVRVSFNRNAHNIYRIIGLGGGVGDKNVTEKKGEFLKTSTPPPAAAASSPSETKLKYEERKAGDAKASAIMREVYELRAKLWAKLKGWKLDKAYERNRMALAASVGRYVPDSEEAKRVNAEAEAWLAEQPQRDAERARKAEEARRVAEVERVEKARLAAEVAEQRRLKDERLDAEFYSPEQVAYRARLDLKIRMAGRVL